MADPTKPPKGFLIAALVFLLVWLVGCGVGCGGLIVGVKNLVDNASNAETSAVGEPFEVRADDSHAAIFTSSSATRCQVDGPDGPVSVDTPEGARGSFESGGRDFELDFTFDTDDGTSYTVDCAGPQGSEFVVIGFSLGFLAFLSAAGVGLVGFILGVIFLIIGLVRRSRWRKQQTSMQFPATIPAGYEQVPPPGYGQAPAGQAPQAPPPGGYAPPPAPADQPPPYAPPPPPGGYPPPPPSPGAPPPPAPPPQGPDGGSGGSPST
jgi:hypothetical protein